MAKNLTSEPSLGLHERALLAGLDLLDPRQAQVPALVEVATELDIPICDLGRLFPNEEALYCAAAENALLHLMDICTRSVVQVDPGDPFAQYQSLGEAYLKWAHDHLRQFRLLSERRVIDILTQPQLRRYVDALHDLMTRMLMRARDDGQLHPREDIQALAITSRSFAFGLARLIVDRRMEEWYPGADPLDAARHALSDFIRRMARSTTPPR